MMFNLVLKYCRDWSLCESCGIQFNLMFMYLSFVHMEIYMSRYKGHWIWSHVWFSFGYFSLFLMHGLWCCILYWIWGFNFLSKLKCNVVLICGFHYQKICLCRWKCSRFWIIYFIAEQLDFRCWKTIFSQDFRCWKKNFSRVTLKRWNVA